MELPDIYSFSLFELEKYLVERLNQPKFRAHQIFRWLYHDITSFDEMSNIPKALRAELSQHFSFFTPKIIHSLKSLDESGTEKYLVQLHDGSVIEMVKMEYHHGISACLSTQVGCKMGCAFCASGMEGFFRNLSAGEMIQQILLMQKQIGKRIGSIVLMGSGEPLDNYDSVVKFLNIVHEKDGLNLGFRHLTLSTCGIAPKIYQLADLGLPITLAVSLHAPTDDLRNRLVPINKKYPLTEILEACRYYLKKTNRRITFEYSLIYGTNDSPQQARELAKLLSDLLCHVNLIPVNTTEIGAQNLDIKASSNKSVQEFQRILSKYHIPNSVRRTLGDDIGAACGQLKSKFVRSKKR